MFQFFKTPLFNKNHKFYQIYRSSAYAKLPFQSLKFGQTSVLWALFFQKIQFFKPYFFQKKKNQFFKPLFIGAYPLSPPLRPLGLHIYTKIKVEYPPGNFKGWTV